MSMLSPSMRHPVVLSLWAGLFVLTGLGLNNSAWFILVFLVSPLVAIGTCSAVFARKEIEVLRRGWWIAYRIASAALALAAFTGVIATAGQLIGDDRQWGQNGPLAFLFLITFVAAWPAVAKASPRRAAIPAMVVHITWLPLVIANAVIEHSQDHVTGPESHWAYLVGGVSLIAILALSAVLAVLSVVVFTGEPRIAPARATGV